MATESLSSEYTDTDINNKGINMDNFIFQRIYLNLGYKSIKRDEREESRNEA